jgi:hypothetical protein
METLPGLTKFTCANCTNVLAWKEAKGTILIIPCTQCYQIRKIVKKLFDGRKDKKAEFITINQASKVVSDDFLASRKEPEIKMRDTPWQDCHTCHYSSPVGGCFKENFYGRKPIEIAKRRRALDHGDCPDWKKYEGEGEMY